MSQQHTPGPWTFHYGQPMDHGEDGGGGFTICMGERSRLGSGRFIHALGYAEDIYSDYDAKDYQEAEANARLIAAAPDLLAAATPLAELVENFTGSDSHFISVTAGELRALAAARAKAVAA